MGSDSTRMVRLDAGDLYSERRYAPFRAYAFSKHALHGFGFELDRRLRAVGDGRASLLAHPGYATSAYASKRPGITGREPGVLRFGEAATGWVGQGKDHGAWPMVRALTDPDAESGQFYGPSRLLAGPPVLTTPVRSSASPAFGARLWDDARRRRASTSRSEPRSPDRLEALTDDRAECVGSAARLVERSSSSDAVKTSCTSRPTCPSAAASVTPMRSTG